MRVTGCSVATRAPVARRGHPWQGESCELSEPVIRPQSGCGRSSTFGSARHCRPSTERDSERRWPSTDSAGAYRNGANHHLGGAVAADAVVGVPANRPGPHLRVRVACSCSDEVSAGQAQGSGWPPVLTACSLGWLGAYRVVGLSSGAGAPDTRLRSCATMRSREPARPSPTGPGRMFVLELSRVRGVGCRARRMEGLLLQHWVSRRP